MNIGLRMGLTIASVAVLIVVALLISKKRLNIKYSIVWLIWSLLLVFMSIFPETFYGISDLLGIELPVNAVFLIMIALLYALTLFVYIMISKHNEEIVKLTYQVALLKKELDELKKKNERQDVCRSRSFCTL